ncbi:EamA domain [Dillenia turbinata]|uniref:EamA domain n=1 Tax=Dillenia turbinata TaxID=194707 RepID=A0AAN8UD36_9MAGN
MAKSERVLIDEIDKTVGGTSEKNGVVSRNKRPLLLQRKTVCTSAAGFPLEEDDCDEDEEMMLACLNTVAFRPEIDEVQKLLLEEELADGIGVDSGTATVKLSYPFLKEKEKEKLRCEYGADDHIYWRQIDDHFNYLQRTRLPPLKFYILKKMFLFVAIGATYQELGNKAISYSSPTLASAMSILIPTFTFIFAIIFRMETMNLRSLTGWVKIIGTLVSISGAFVVTFYKGPPITRMKPMSTSSYGPFRASESNWVIGGLLLTAEYVMMPLWFIIQADIIKKYPSELVVVFFYTLFATLVSGVMGIIVEPKLDAWIQLPGVALVAIVYSGIVGSVLTNAAFAWVIHLKGPVFAAMFQPLAIAIAVAMGVVFLGETLNLGSVIGAAIITIGFYAVIWGKANEGTDKNCEGSLEASSSKGPLCCRILRQKIFEFVRRYLHIYSICNDRKQLI